MYVVSPTSASNAYLYFLLFAERRFPFIEEQVCTLSATESLCLVNHSSWRERLNSGSRDSLENSSLGRPKDERKCGRSPRDAGELYLQQGWWLRPRVSWQRRCRTLRVCPASGTLPILLAWAGSADLRAAGGTS